MSQNTLIEKIKKDAAATIAEIKSTGAAEVEGVKRGTEAAIEVLRKEHAVALDKKLSHMELVAVSRAKQEGNIAVQRAKRDQIDSVFTEIRHELEELSDEEYVAFFIKYVREIVPKGVVITTIEAPASRQAVTKKILENLGLQGEVTTVASIKAGLIVHASDGVYDITLERLMNEKRAELEMSVVNQIVE